MIELEAKIKEVIQRTYNVKSVRLDVGSEPNFQAGQFCYIRLLSEKECQRYLSISSSPTEGYIEFTKKITQSDFSKTLDTLGPGDLLRIKYPFGNFTLQDTDNKIAFLSGGIGITPIRSIIKYAADKKLDKDIVLLYANHTVQDIVFKEDFAALQKEYPKLKIYHVLSEAAPGFNCLVGRINAQVIKDEVPDHRERRFYLCGPPAMVEAMSRILTDELALAKESIITENFQGY